MLSLLTYFLGFGLPLGLQAMLLSFSDGLIFISGLSIKPPINYHTVQVQLLIRVNDDYLIPFQSFVSNDYSAPANL